MYILIPNLFKYGGSHTIPKLKKKQNRHLKMLAICAKAFLNVILVAHFRCVPALSSVTLTLCISLPLLLPHCSSIFNILCPINSLSLIWVCANHLSLQTKLTTLVNLSFLHLQLYPLVTSCPWHVSSSNPPLSCSVVLDGWPQMLQLIHLW